MAQPEMEIRGVKYAVTLTSNFRLQATVAGEVVTADSEQSLKTKIVHQLDRKRVVIAIPIIMKTGGPNEGGPYRAVPAILRSPHARNFGYYSVTVAGKTEQINSPTILARQMTDEQLHELNTAYRALADALEVVTNLERSHAPAKDETGVFRMRSWQANQLVKEAEAAAIAAAT